MGRKFQVSKRERGKRRKDRRQKRKRDARVTAEFGARAPRSCGRKRRYATREEVVALESLRLGKDEMLRTYPCRYCEGWHITHKGRH